MNNAAAAIRKVQETRCQFSRLLRYRALFRTPLEKAEFERLLRQAYCWTYDAEQLLRDTFASGDLFTTDLAELEQTPEMGVDNGP